MTRHTAARRRLGDTLAWFAAAALLALLGGCGGGSGGGPDPADTTPPELLDVSPAQGATGIRTTAGIDLHFSEAMDTASVEAAFALTGPSGAVPGALAWNAGHDEARFSPATPLTPGQQFTVTVGAGARDVAGNPLASPRTLSFTTVDVPEVVDAFPGEGWTGVDTRAELRVSFGAVMDTASLQAAFSLTTGGAPVAGTLRFTGNEWGGTDLHFKPDPRLVPVTPYDAVVTTAAADADGTHLSSAWHLSFTTGAAPQRTLTVGNSPNSLWLNRYGRVVDDLGRIDCGGDRTRCSASYDEGTVVTLTPIAGPAAAFTGWTGDDCWTLGAAPTATLTLDVGRSCTATWEIPQGTTTLVSVTYGPWIERVYESVGFGQVPRLDCGPLVSPSVCEYAFPSAIQVNLRAVKEATAPAGTITWLCTSDDLADPPTSPDLAFLGELSGPIWPNRPKTCHVGLAVAPP